MSTYIPIQSITLSSAASSVIFSSIPQTFTDLVIVAEGYMATGDGYVVWTQFNGDTSSSYSYTALGTNGSTTSTPRSTNLAQIELTTSIIGWDTDSTQRGNIIAQIMDYTNTNTYKSLLCRASLATASYPGTVLAVGNWRKTEAINSITLTTSGGTFASSSTFTLYGIASGSAKATGGEVTITGGYAYHTFRSSGQFIPLENITADVLVVAGGGAGGNAYVGGGGGAGGLRLLASQNINVNTINAVIVGAGGAPRISIAATGAGNGSRGGNGTNSSAFGISTTGGGGGSSTYTGSIYEAATSGGSGGGSSYTFNSQASGNAGGYSPVEGYGGGTSTDATSGGGGGAGGAGNPGNGTTGGDGGTGVNSYNSISFSTWLTATNTGSSGNLAGGGGGAAFGGSAPGRLPGNGGLGGGGRGGSQNSSYFNAVAGTANTGGGGGGTDRNGNNIGGAGGSGLVIVRYAV